MAIKKDGSKQRKKLASAKPVKAPKVKVAKPGFIDMRDPEKLAVNNAYFASFPEMNASPILELDRKGHVVYLNPACQRLFPDLLELSIKHPFLADWAKVIKELDTPDVVQPVIHIVATGKLFFEQAYFAVNENRIRIYCRDLTKHKQAEEKAELQALLLDACSDSLLWSNSHGKFIYLNEAACRTHGYTHDEMMKMNINDMIVPEYRQIVQDKINEVLKTGDVIFECAHFRKDGSIMPVEIHARVFEWKSGKHVLGISRDISERKKAEEALRESEEKFRAIVEYSRDLIFRLNNEAEFVYVSPSVTEMLGYNQKDLIGKPFLSLVHPDDINIIETAIANTDMAGHQGTDDNAYRFRHASGEWRWHVSAGIRLHDSSKNFLYFIGAARDITEHRKIEIALKESEERYHTIFESANDIIILMDTDGKIIDVNARLTDIGGYLKDELIGKNIRDLTEIISEKNMPLVVANLYKTIIGQGVLTYPVEMIKKNSEPIYLEITAVPIRKDYKIIGVLAVLKDITERNKSELQIREQKALTDRILESDPNAVIVVGQDQRVVKINKAFEDTFEVKQSKAEGKEISEIIPAFRFINAISQVLASGKSQLQIEFRIKRGILERVLLADIIGMQKNEVLAILRDVTDEREMQESLYLTDRLASVGEMAAGIAHELNNPLTGVVALSQLLLESGVPDNMKEDLVTIRKEGQRAASIVKNLLSFARSHTTSIQAIDINEIISEVLNLRAYEHKANNIEVITHLAPNFPEIMADRFQMQQVFLNIILNAEQAMKELEGPGNITVTSERLNGFIRISFADSGQGIPPEIMNRIFDPFFTTKEVGKGTGLGLSISYGIITNQGGKIYAQSEPGNGATFIIELPLNAQ